MHIRMLKKDASP